MHSLEKKTRGEDRFLNPSFSSTLLDKICRSMDEGERKSKSDEMKFYRETTTEKKQNRSSNIKCNRNMIEEEQGKRKDKKVVTEKPCFVLPTHHHGYHRDHDQDALFFSSTSISSDSSSGGFSSSDTESSMYGTMSRASRASCFAPPPKPNKPVVKKKNIEKQKQATTRMFDGFCHNSKTEGIAIHDDDDDDEKALFKSKLRALKIYNNLKKVKQPISPGGRLTSFLNSLFANNAKKTRSSSGSSCYYEDMNTERKVKVKAKSSSSSVQPFSSTCSSASSFSRSCLSKTSSCEREKMFNGVKRTVSFHPVSVIVDEEEGKSLKGLKIGRSNTKKKKEEENKSPVLEKSRVVEEAAREFLEEYHHNQKSDLPLRTFSAPFETVATAAAKRINIVNGNEEEEGDDDDDDAASYASSDLFELDHLSVLGNGRYCEELPVYETTHVSTNRAIVNGLVM